MDYVALEVKTSYSMLESLNHIDKLVLRAKELGYKALAITDYNMFGVISFYKECKKHGIKPIIGLSLNVDNHKVLLYAISNDGYKNLIKLATISSEREVNINDLMEYKDNVVLIMPYSSYEDKIYNIYENKYIGYYNKIEKEKIESLNKVFINEVSYILENDYRYLDYAKMIKEGRVLGEYELNKDKGKHLLTYEEVIEFSSDLDIKNTFDIANMCNVDIGYTKGLLPVYDVGVDAFSYLSDLCKKGLNKRLGGNVSDIYQERLDYELEIINKMGFCNYFLIVWDYVKYAKKNDILVGPGRGSAASSLVSYVLGITDIDPIKNDLLFERFLNPQRITMPDIDIDFDALKRDEVIDYVKNKYGEKRVAGIITFNTLGAKQVIRDVARVLKIPSSMADNISKMILESNLKLSYEKNSRLANLINGSSNLKKMYDIALKLEGLPRHVSVHAAGIVMSNDDIDKVIPLYKNELGMYLTGYSMDYLEELGLLKMDFLSIKNLTLIADVISNIRKNDKLNITFANIPINNDKKVMELFKSGKTDGIFQFESEGMRSFLAKLKPETIDDLTLALALYRPGPMDNIDSFIRRKNGKEKIDYIDEVLVDILKPTYGIIIYQEQIMQIANVLAGYSLGEADILRKAMAKKKEDILLKEQEKFISRCIKQGHSKEVAFMVYNLILKFANYGFNKSHSVSYAVVAYKMAFLKTYFYKYFMGSLLSNANYSEVKMKAYLLELKAKHVNLIMPNINKSTDCFEVFDGDILMPFTIIKNIGVVTVKEIIKERNKGPFLSFTNFVVRMKRFLNKKIITNLILAGCFSDFYNKKTLIENLDNILNYADLVSDNGGLIEVEEPIIKEYEEYEIEVLIEKEILVFGFYLGHHPVLEYKDINDIAVIDIFKFYDKVINIKLYVEKVSEIITKNNDVMAFVNASDEYGEITLTFFKDKYSKFRESLKKGNVLKITGVVQKRYDKYQVVVNNVLVLNKN